MLSSVIECFSIFPVLLSVIVFQATANDDQEGFYVFCAYHELLLFTFLTF